MKMVAWRSWLFKILDGGHEKHFHSKADKAAALPKFSDMLTLSQPGGANYAYQLTLLS